MSKYYVVEVKVKVDPERLPDIASVRDAVMDRVDLGSNDGILDCVSGDVDQQDSF